MSEDERPQAPEAPEETWDEALMSCRTLSAGAKERVLDTLGVPREPLTPEEAEDRAVWRAAMQTAKGTVVTGTLGEAVTVRYPDGRPGYGYRGTDGTVHPFPGVAEERTPWGEEAPRSGRRRRPPNAQALPPGGKLPQQTFAEAKTVAAGLADGPKQRGWEPVEGEASLLHRVDRQAPLVTLVRGGPLLDWLGLPATVQGLRDELRQAGLPAVLLFHVLIGGSLELAEKNRVYVTVAVDDLVTAIGWHPRSTTEREGMRRRVWRWIAILDAAEVIGCRPGIYRDPGSRQPLELVSRDALLRVVGRREPAQLAFDHSAPPLEVTYVAGPWIERFRGNHRVLSFFKVDVRRVAAIPAGKPSGAWAQSAGLALHQKWRERAAAERGPGTFTRRELLDLFPPDPTLDDILASDTPHRARAFWRDAIGLLKQHGLLGHYREIGALEDKRQGWGDAWADQPLDLRPPAGEARDGVAEIASRAASVRARGPRRRRAPAKEHAKPPE